MATGRFLLLKLPRFLVRCSQRRGSAADGTTRGRIRRGEPGAPPPGPTPTPVLHSGRKHVPFVHVKSFNLGVVPRSNCGSTPAADPPRAAAAPPPCEITQTPAPFSHTNAQTNQRPEFTPHVLSENFFALDVRNSGGTSNSAKHRRGSLWETAPVF